MRIYRIYGVYSSNHFFSISYAAYVKLLSCKGLPSAKNCMGTLPLDSPKLNKDGSITLWNRCMMQKKHFGKQQKRFYCRNHKDYLPSNMRENKLPRDILRNHGSTGQLSSPSRSPRSSRVRQVTRRFTKKLLES